MAISGASNVVKQRVSSNSSNWTSMNNVRITDTATGGNAASVSNSSSEIESMDFSVDQDSDMAFHLHRLKNYLGNDGYRENATFEELIANPRFQELVSALNLDPSSLESREVFDCTLNELSIQETIDINKQELNDYVGRRDKFVEALNLDDTEYQTFYREYNNEKKILIQNTVSEFDGNVETFFSKCQNLGTNFEPGEIDYYANVIFECIGGLKNNVYTKEQLVEIFSNSSDEIWDVIELFNSGGSQEKKESAVIKFSNTYETDLSAIDARYDELLKGKDIATIDELSNYMYVLEHYDSTINDYNGYIDELKRQLIQAGYAKIMNSEDYKNFDFYKYDDVSIDPYAITSEHGKTYCWNDTLDISPIDYIKCVCEDNDQGITWDNIISSFEDGTGYSLLMEFFDIDTGSAYAAGDYEHDDLYDLVNLIIASKYDPSILQMYQYKYYNEGLEAANQYILDTKRNTRQIIAQNSVQSRLSQFNTDGKDYTFIDPITGKTYEYSVKVDNGQLIVDGLGDGFAQFFQGLLAWANTDSEKTVEEWEQYYFMMSLLSTEDKVAAGLIDENGKSISPYIDFTVDYSQGGLSSIEYNISTSIGNMLPSMVINTMCPPLGVVVMGLSSGGNSFRDAVTSGYGLGEAYLYGIISGTSEAALEYALGSIPGISKAAETRIPGLASFLKAAFDEGKEEFIQEGLDIIIRCILFDEKPSVVEIVEQLGTSFLYGMATSGILNSFDMNFQYNRIDTVISEMLNNNDANLTNGQIAKLTSDMFGLDIDEDFVNKIQKGEYVPNALDNTIFMPGGFEVDEAKKPDIDKVDVRETEIKKADAVANPSVKTEVVGPTNFGNMQEVASFFGDSNLYLLGAISEKFKNGDKSLNLSEYRKGLYSGNQAIIDSAIGTLTSEELATYNSIKNSENSSIQSNWQSSLTEDERSALRGYAEMFGSIDAYDALDMYGYDSNGNSYVTMTELMRAGKIDGNPLLDSALEKFGKLPQEIEVYRGVGLSALTSQFGDIDVNNLESLIGKTYTDAAYMSTSLLEYKGRAAAGNSTDVVLQITVPTDANYGAYIESLSNLNYNQMEFLIKRNSQATITDAYVNSDGKIVVKMELFSDNSNIDNVTEVDTLNANDFEFFVTDRVSSSISPLSADFDVSQLSDPIDYFSEFAKQNEIDYYDVLNFTGREDIDQETKCSILIAMAKNNLQLRAQIYDNAVNQMRVFFEDSSNFIGDAASLDNIITEACDALLGTRDKFLSNNNGIFSVSIFNSNGHSWEEFVSIVEPYMREKILKNASSSEAILWSNLDTKILNSKYTTIENCTFGEEFYSLDLAFPNWNSDGPGIPKLLDLWQMLSKVYAETCCNIIGKDGQKTSSVRLLVDENNTMGECFAKTELPTILADSSIKTIVVENVTLNDAGNDYISLGENVVNIESLSVEYRGLIRNGMSAEMAAELCFEKFKTLVSKKKLFEMTPQEINNLYAINLGLLSIWDSNYFYHKDLLYEQKELEIQLAQKMANVDISSNEKSIDMLPEFQQQQVRQAAKEVYDRAKAHEASVTALMQNLVDSRATLEGLDYRVKSINSIEDKLSRKVSDYYSVEYAKNSINDSLRYTLLVSGDYKSTVLQKLNALYKDGYTVVDMRNAWGGSLYQGLNTTLMSPDGMLIELQFHTPYSFWVKQELNHNLYELSRNLSIPGDIRLLSDKIQQINQEVYVGYDTIFEYNDVTKLMHDVVNYVKDYKVYNGYDEFLADNQANLDSWQQAVSNNLQLQRLLNEYKGESQIAPASYKISNAYLRKTLFDDATQTVTITDTYGVPKTYSYAEFESMVGCSISEYRQRVEAAIQTLSSGISECHLAVDTELVRGVHWDTLQFLFGISEYDSIDVINEKLAAVGVWNEPGFMSACPSVLESDLPDIVTDKKIRLIMECEEGMEARVFPSDWEKEILLNCGQSFEIKSAEYDSNGLLIIRMKHIPN